MARKKVEPAGPAIAGTAGARSRPTSISGKRLAIILIIGAFSVMVATVTSLHHGFGVGSLIVKPASGDSMLPWSHDGDTLVAWGNFTLIPGKKYLFRISGDLQCKKLSKVDSDTLHFESINPEGSQTTYFTAKRNEIVGEAKWVLPTHYLWRNSDDTNPVTSSMTRVTTEQKIAAYRNALEAEHKAKKLLTEQRARAIPCSNSPTCDGNLKTSVTLSRGKTLVIKPQEQFRHLALWAQSDDEIWVNGRNTGTYSGQWCHKDIEAQGDKLTIEVRQASGKMAPPGAMIAEIVFFR